MQNDVKAINSFTRQLAVEVPWEELEDKYQQFLKKFASRIKVPGFRKGKMPAQLVRKQFGAAAEADFTESVIQEYYLAGIDAAGLEPINQAAIRGVHFHEGGTLRFVATFEIEPEVSLPTYAKGMKLHQVIFDMDDHDIDKAVEDLQLRQATLRTVEDGADDNHFILADLQEVDAGGAPLIGRKIENQYIHLTADGPFGGENLANLKGANPGDTRRVKLAGETGEAIYYEVTARQISERIVPELNDAFAKQSDVKAETVAELRVELGRRIQTAYDRESEQRLTRSIADHFVRNAKLEAPASMVENYLENLVSDLEKEGHPPESIDREALKAEHLASINWNIKWYLLRKALLEVEEISVDDEAVQQKIDELIADDESSGQQIRNYYRRPENRRNMKEELTSGQLMEKLKTYAKIKTEHKPSSELRKASQVS